MSDLDGVCFVRRGNALVPADIHADEWLNTVRDGKEVIVSPRRARNVKHHRLFFGLLKKFHENTEGWSDLEEVLDAVKYATGHVSRFQDLDGKMRIRPKSISFAAMDQDSFRRFFDRAAFFLAQYLGVDTDTLIDEVYQEQGEKRVRDRK